MSFFTSSGTIYEVAAPTEAISTSAASTANAEEAKGGAAVRWDPGRGVEVGIGLVTVGVGVMIWL